MHSLLLCGSCLVYTNCMKINKPAPSIDTLFASLGGLDTVVSSAASSAPLAAHEPSPPRIPEPELPVSALSTSNSPSTGSTGSTGSTSGRSGLTSSVEDRALHLLGSGVQAEAVASALGVTPSRIAQLLSEKHFAGKVAELRYENLQSHNRRDSSYDTLEDKLLTKLNASLYLLQKPESILRAINIVNNAKRRGQSAPAQVTNQQNVVNLILPAIIAEKFAINIDNQVTKAGDQELLTMAPGNLLKQVEAANEQRILEHTLTEETSHVQEDGS